MYLKIYAAITEFQVYLVENIGKPVDVGTLGAFTKMVRVLMENIWSE